MYQILFDLNTKDHPRLCGEKPLFLRRYPDLKGSPPPMRGKAFGGIHVVICQGITPAYAGKRGFVCKEIDRT